MAGDLAEDNVLAVEPRRRHRGDEELPSQVSARDEGSVLLWLEVAWLPFVLGPALAMLIGKFVSVNRFSTGTIALGEITALLQNF